FHKADLTKSLPIEDDTFDCVVSIEVIEHVENHFQFMRELLRVTKPGGMVILTTPNVLSLTSRWYYFRYGFNDCAPMPLDPHLEEYWMEHLNPISAPEILYLFERFGADMVDLTTNRKRKSTWVPYLLLFPFLWLGMRIKFLRKKFGERLPLHRRHVKWMLSRANLMGRITIAVGRKRDG
ncbi:MAG: class I SAM-dependent methyltransferase, partial [Gemmatimonadales bacterium]